MTSVPGDTPRYANIDGISFKKLFAPGHAPVFLRSQNIAANQVILPGTVLGRITSSGYLIPCVKTANDGSQLPYAVAHRYIDTTANGPAGVSAVQPAAVVGHGTLFVSGLIIDSSWGATPDLAWAGIEAALRAINIFGVYATYSY